MGLSIKAREMQKKKDAGGAVRVFRLGCIAWRYYFGAAAEGSEPVLSLDMTKDI